jgi:multimeric flavodoxin WrbA
MKIIAIIGSNRKRGNTARAVHMILEEIMSTALPGERVEAEVLFLGDFNIHLCRGCRACFDRGETFCPLKDDIPALFDRLRAADGLIIASPVYVDDVSGLMKMWIDRLAFLCHRPALARQSVLLAATSGGSPCNHTLRTLSAALLTWGASIAGQVGFKMGALMPDAELETIRPQARRAARLLLRDLLAQRRKKPSLLSLIVFRVQQLSWRYEDPRTTDVRYWQEQGWLDDRCDFYYPHSSGGLKRMLAKWAGNLLKKVVA